MRIHEYWPRFLQELLEFQEIAAGEQPEFDMVWQLLREAPQEFYVSSMSLLGIRRWERILGILPTPGATEEERRFTVEARLLEQLPYSWRNLLIQLSLLCGEGRYTASLDADSYTVDIRVALESKHKLDDVDAMLHRMVPANMIVLLDLLYNQHQLLKFFTHGELAQFTHAQLRANSLGVP